jgi:vacuolar-type H+-ATPase subunit H
MKALQQGFRPGLGVNWVSRDEVLGKIRAAEAQRRELEEGARKRKEEILKEAQREARRIVDEAAAEAEAAASELIKIETARIQEERRRVVTAGEREVSRHREGSSARLPEAVDRLYKEFLRQVNAQTP